MAFVPEGQADSSQARSAWVIFRASPSRNVQFVEPLRDNKTPKIGLYFAPFCPVPEIKRYVAGGSARRIFQGAHI